MLPSQKEKVPPPHFKQRECFMNVHVFLLVCLLIFSLALLCALCWLHHGPSKSSAAKVRTALPRLLKPRSPHDCPACRLASTLSTGVEPAAPPVRPWREVKSRRGAVLATWYICSKNGGFNSRSVRIFAEDKMSSSPQLYSSNQSFVRNVMISSPQLYFT